MLASGGIPENCHVDPAPKSGVMGAVVAMKLPPTLIIEFGPKEKPYALARTTVPLALSVPQIRDGLAPPMLFKTIESAEGWMKRVISPG